MKNKFKNKLWYFLPMLLVLIYARPVEAIMWEFDNSWCNLPFLIMAYWPLLFVLFFFCAVFLKKKKAVIIFSLITLVSLIFLFAVLSLSFGLFEEYIFAFGNEFCYNDDGKGRY